MSEQILNYERYAGNDLMASFYTDFLAAHEEILTQICLDEYADPKAPSDTRPQKSRVPHHLNNNITRFGINQSAYHNRLPLEVEVEAIALTFGLGTDPREEASYHYAYDTAIGFFPVSFNMPWPITRMALPGIDFDNTPSILLLKGIVHTSEQLGVSAVVAHSGKSFHAVFADPVLSDVDLWHRWGKLVTGILTFIDNMPDWAIEILRRISESCTLSDIFEAAAFIKSRISHAGPETFQVPVDFRHLANSLIYNKFPNAPKVPQLNILTQQFFRFTGFRGERVPKIVQEIRVPSTLWFTELPLKEILVAANSQ